MRKILNTVLVLILVVLLFPLIKEKATNYLKESLSIELPEVSLPEIQKDQEPERKLQIVDVQEAIESLSIVTTSKRVTVRNTTTFESGYAYLPNPGVRVEAQATVLAGFDLDNITEDRIIINDNSVTIFVPPPSIIGIRNPYIEVLETSFTTLYSNSEQVHNACIDEAMFQLQKTAIDDGLFEEATNHLNRKVAYSLSSILGKTVYFTVEHDLFKPETMTNQELEELKEDLDFSITPLEEKEFKPDVIR